MPHSVEEPASEYSQIVHRWRSEGSASVEHDLRELHASRPDDAQVTKMLALTLSTLDRHDEAKEMLLQALAQAPTSPELLLALGSVQIQHRDCGDAELTARQLLEVKPDSAGAQLLLGNALTGQARFREALGPLGRALRRRDTRRAASGLYCIAVLARAVPAVVLLLIALVMFSGLGLLLAGRPIFGLGAILVPLAVISVLNFRTGRREEGRIVLWVLVGSTVYLSLFAILWHYVLESW